MTLRIQEDKRSAENQDQKKVGDLSLQPFSLPVPAGSPGAAVVGNQRNMTVTVYFFAQGTPWNLILLLYILVSFTPTFQYLKSQHLKMKKIKAFPRNESLFPFFLDT